MYGLAGYAPVGTTSADEILRTHGPRLRALTGHRLESATGLCFVLSGEWCFTLPLLLDFGAVRLELAFDGFDLMYLSWDTIDTDARIDTEDQDDPDQALAWDDPHQPELDGVLGATVAQVRVLEQEITINPAHGPGLHPWCLAGLEVLFDDGRTLQLYNIISELTLATRPADADNWRRRVAPIGFA